ncbi:5'/3'-nucleotidase SurE [Zavarzinia sp. CC-PAN008]|uniref:5'/3'-nucleotidase SurE n=1 Tax=Zavarzinia sp. CC-PAN008 TaxID=3243332 RepID=UPI003F744CDD
MAETPLRILCVNDDGIHAPGLKILEKIARALTSDVWVVAPETEMSGAGHSLTLASPIRMRKIKAKRFAVTGTPTDCVLMAVAEVMGKRRPDLVLSGVNRGANLGEDVTYSGTVAGAIEGTLLGIRSIALSQTYGLAEDGPRVPWETALAHGPQVVRTLLQADWPRDIVMNVNFPDRPPDGIAGIEVTTQGRREQSEIAISKRTDARGFHYYWMGFKRVPFRAADGTDLGAIQAGRIAVTPLHLDLSHHATLDGLKRAFGTGPA